MRWILVLSVVTFSVVLTGCRYEYPVAAKKKPPGPPKRATKKVALEEETKFNLLPKLAALDLDDAVNESQVDRKLSEEPDYKSDDPRYALLVIGPERNLRVWMVLDGFTLYADANLDGRIDPKFEKFKVADEKTDPTNFEKFTVADGGIEFEIEVGLWSWDFGKAEFEDMEQSISVNCPDGMRFIAWGDHHTALKFKPSMEKPPVVHVGGPLQLGFEVRTPFDRKGENEFEIAAAVGTFGLGEGSFSNLIYSVIPPEAQPDVTVTIPSETEGQSPIVIETTLDHRC